MTTRTSLANKSTRSATYGVHMVGSADPEPGTKQLEFASAVTLQGTKLLLQAVIDTAEPPPDPIERDAQQTDATTILLDIAGLDAGFYYVVGDPAYIRDDNGNYAYGAFIISE